MDIVKAIPVWIERKESRGMLQLLGADCPRNGDGHRLHLSVLARLEQLTRQGLVWIVKRKDWNEVICKAEYKGLSVYLSWHEYPEHSYSDKDSILIGTKGVAADWLIFVATRKECMHFPSVSGKATGGRHNFYCRRCREPLGGLVGLIRDRYDQEIVGKRAVYRQFSEKISRFGKYLFRR